LFPGRFFIQFTPLNGKNKEQINFEKVPTSDASYPVESANVYTIDDASNGQIKKINLESSQLKKNVRIDFLLNNYYSAGVRGIEIPEIRRISAENLAGIPVKFFFQLFRLFFRLFEIIIKI
jgi:hypothetical protein